MKHIEKGINPPSVDEIYFSGNYLLKGIRIGIVAGMIALTVYHLLPNIFVSVNFKLFNSDSFFFFFVWEFII